MIATKLDITNAAKIQKDGLTALKNALGITATIKFLEQFDQGGTGDYTAEKYQKEEPELTDEDDLEPTDDEIRRMFGC